MPNFHSFLPLLFISFFIWSAVAKSSEGGRCSQATPFEGFDDISCRCELPEACHGISGPRTRISSLWPLIGFCSKFRNGLTRRAPSPAIEIVLSFGHSFGTQRSISGNFVVTPKISPNSWLFGLTNWGLRDSGINQGLPFKVTNHAPVARVDAINCLYGIPKKWWGQTLQEDYTSSAC